MNPKVLTTTSLLALLAGATPALADSGNFELSGHIYTKWMYKNDDSRGCLSLSNPFWSDNIGGSNGVCTEFELSILGRVSKHVTAGVRLQSRWGALWQGWWENGDTRWDYPTDTLFTENTSGESMGMNHAQYIKLRGVFIRAALPIPTVKWVHVGATDLGMFNEWTVGKSRYIDRDNGNGVFFEGQIGDTLRYHTGAIAVPKLFVGPRWTSGLKDGDPLAGFWGADWAYALKLEAAPIDGLELRAIGTYVHDWEADKNDPDKTGGSDVTRNTDRAVDLEPRFRSVNATLDGKYVPPAVDFLSVSGLLAFSLNSVNPEYATNAVRNDQGFSPLVYLQDANGDPEDAIGAGGKILVEVFDPFEIGLSAKVEYFNIGTDFNAIFGSRREADVLITDGIIPSGFGRGGQLPTLNLANEFVDFDEPWYEAIIGWHGATALLEYTRGNLSSKAEYTLITYNTNAQGRDVDNEYPDFLYTDGFTDTQAYTADADYANVFDRGRDPRSVYHEYQDRLTHIVAAQGEYLIAGPLTARGKVKWVHDTDERKTDNPNDNYRGDMYVGYAQLDYQATDELKTSLGYELQVWDETKRSGSQETAFYDYDTVKHTGRFIAGYNYGGVSFGYLLEYFHKDQERDRPGTSNQLWSVWRSKATIEVGW